MTITELYMWALKNGVEDLEMEIQNCDEGGCYSGTHEADPEIEMKDGKADKVIL